MSDMQVKVTGGVLPPGTLAKAELPSGDTHELEIVGVEPGAAPDPEAKPPQLGQNPVVRVKYPDEFVKSHEYKDLPDLLDKITRQLKARYPVESFEFEALPPIALGAKLVIKGVK